METDRYNRYKHFLCRYSVNKGYNVTSNTINFFETNYPKEALCSEDSIQLVKQLQTSANGKANVFATTPGKVATI
jgi:hypothetical protein